MVVSPRVLKPDEEGLWLWLLDLAPDAILVRSAGLLQQLNAHRNAAANAADDALLPAVPPLLGDFSLNAANALSAAWLFEAGQLEALESAHDLNALQVTCCSKPMPCR